MAEIRVTVPVSFDVKTGKAKAKEEIRAFQEEIKNSFKNIKITFDVDADNNLKTIISGITGVGDAAKKTAEETKKAAKEIAESFKEVGAEAEKSNKNQATFKDNFLSVLKGATGFYSVWAAVRMTYKGIHDMANEVRELDKAMVELKKVSDDVSESSLVAIQKRAYSAGVELGRTGRTIIDATTEFKRAGYTLEESFSLGKVAVKMMNVGENITDTGQAAGDLIAILKGFRLEAKDAAGVVDLLNEVSNKAAVNFDDLTNGLKRSSAVMAQGGNSIAETIAMLTGGYELSRNMEKMSSGLMTIQQRLLGIKELSATGNIADSFVGKQLKEVTGIDIADANGQLRDTFDIMQDIAMVWNTLNKNQQQFLGEKLAGKLRIPQFQAIISNWQGVEKAIQASNTAYRSADEENARYLDSIEGRLNTFQSKVQLLATKTFSPEFMKGIISAGTTLLDILVGTGGLAPSLKTVAGILVAIKSMQIANTLSGAAVAAEKLAAGLLNAANAGTLFSSMNAVLATIGLVIAAVGVAQGVYNKYMQSISEQHQQYYDSAVEGSERLRAATERGDDFNEQISSIKQLNEEIENYKGSAVGLEQQKAILEGRINSLAAAVGTEVGQQATLTGTYRDQIAALDELIEKKRASDLLSSSTNIQNLETFLSGEAKSKYNQSLTRAFWDEIVKDTIYDNKAVSIKAGTAIAAILEGNNPLGDIIRNLESLGHVGLTSTSELFGTGKIGLELRGTVDELYSATQMLLDYAESIQYEAPETAIFLKRAVEEAVYKDSGNGELGYEQILEAKRLLEEEKATKERLEAEQRISDLNNTAISELLISAKDFAKATGDAQIALEGIFKDKLAKVLEEVAKIEDPKEREKFQQALEYIESIAKPLEEVAVSASSAESGLEGVASASESVIDAFDNISGIAGAMQKVMNDKPLTPKEVGTLLTSVPQASEAITVGANGAIQYNKAALLNAFDQYLNDSISTVERGLQQATEQYNDFLNNPEKFSESLKAQGITSEQRENDLRQRQLLLAAELAQMKAQAAEAREQARSTIVEQTYGQGQTDFVQMISPEVVDRLDQALQNLSQNGVDKVYSSLNDLMKASYEQKTGIISFGEALYDAKSAAKDMAEAMSMASTQEEANAMMDAFLGALGESELFQDKYATNEETLSSIDAKIAEAEITMSLLEQSGLAADEIEAHMNVLKAGVEELQQQRAFTEAYDAANLYSADYRTEEDWQNNTKYRDQLQEVFDQMQEHGIDTLKVDIKGIEYNLDTAMAAEELDAKLAEIGEVGDFKSMEEISKNVLEGIELGGEGEIDAAMASVNDAIDKVKEKIGGLKGKITFEGKPFQYTFEVTKDAMTIGQHRFEYVKKVVGKPSGSGFIEVKGNVTGADGSSSGGGGSAGSTGTKPYRQQRFEQAQANKDDQRKPPDRLHNDGDDPETQKPQRGGGGKPNKKPPKTGGGGGGSGGKPEKETPNEELDIEIHRLKAIIALMKERNRLAKQLRQEYRQLTKELRTSMANPAYADPTLRETMFNLDDYEKLKSKLDSVSAEYNTMYEQYLADLKSADTKAQIDYVTKQYKVQFDIKSKEFAIVEKQIKLQKAQTELLNAQAQKNVRTFGLNAETGVYSWSWQADYEKVQQAQNKINDAQGDYDEALVALREALELAQLQYKLADLEYKKETGEMPPVIATARTGEDLADLIAAVKKQEEESKKKQDEIIASIEKAAKMVAASGGVSPSSIPTYDSGGILKGIGGIKATMKEEGVMSPYHTALVLDPANNQNWSKFVNNLPNLFNALPVINAMAQRGQEQAQTGAGQIVYSFNNVNVTANDIDEFINSIELLVPSRV